MNKYTNTQNIRRSVKLSALALVAGSAFFASGCAPGSTKDAPQIHSGVSTVTHDSHLFVIYSGYKQGGILHHPDCPCGKR